MNKTFSKPPLNVLLIFCVSVLYFGWYCTQRLIAGDEGFYLYGAKLVSLGQIPYKDFFYPQMPYLPFVYGAGFLLFGTSWTTARLLSAVAAALTCALLSNRVYQRSGSPLYAWFFALLFCSSNFVFPWLICGQSYSFSVLFLVASACALDRNGATYPSTKRILLSGLFLGLATGSRLFFAGVGPLFVLWLWSFKASVRDKVKSGALLTAATFAALLPVVPLALRAPSAFYFNNLGYHFSRSAMAPAEAWANKSRVSQVLFGLVDSVKFDALHLPLLLWIFVALTPLAILVRALTFRERRHPTLLSLMWLCSIGVLALNLYPTPTYVQYFCSIVPFVYLAVADMFWGLTELTASRFPTIANKRTVLLTAISLIVLGLHLPSTWTDMERYSKTGEGVIGIRTQENARLWTLTKVRKIAATFDELASPGAIVFTPWPGHLLESKAKAFPGTENHFGIRTAKGMPDERQDELKIASFGRVVKSLDNPDERPLVIAVNVDGKHGRFVKNIRAKGYQEVRQEAPLSFFMMAENTPSAASSHGTD